MHLPCPRPLPKKNKQRGGVRTRAITSVYHVLSDVRYATTSSQATWKVPTAPQRRKKSEALGGKKNEKRRLWKGGREKDLQDYSLESC
jgi:hypothetical protein